MDLRRALEVQAAAEREARAVADVFNYWAAEFRKLGDTSEGVKVKFWNSAGDEGETRWLSLTPEQFEHVKRTMLEVQED